MRRIAFSDLGDRTRCGQDLVISRAKTKTLRDAVIDSYATHFPYAKEISRDLQKKLYEDKEVRLNFTHNMKLSDGSYWGGKKKITVTIAFGHHLQYRMDERCVPISDVVEVIRQNLLKLEKLWLAGKWSQYSDLFKVFEQKKEKDSGGLRHSDLGTPIANVNMLTHNDAPYRGPANLTVSVPTRSAFTLKVITILMYPARHRISEAELEDQKCVKFLQDNGFRVVKKGSRIASRGRGTAVSSVTDWRDGKSWLGRRLKKLHTTVNYSEFSREIAAMGLRDVTVGGYVSNWVRNNLLEPSLAGDTSTYTRNMINLLTKEVKIEVEGRQGSITVKAEAGQGVSEELLHGEVVPVPDNSYEGTVYLSLNVVGTDSGDEALELSLGQQKLKAEIDRCVERLKPYYHITPPRG